LIFTSLEENLAQWYNAIWEFTGWLNAVFYAFIYDFTNIGSPTYLDAGGFGGIAYAL
jgi:hypothetical protein